MSQPSRPGAASTNDDLWLDDAPAGSPGPGSHKRRGVFVVALAVCLAGVGIPVGLALSSAASAPQADHGHRQAGHTQLAQGPAVHQVLTALSTTTDSGSFQFTYSLSSTPPTGVSTDGSESPVSGLGTIDTDPMAMAAYAAVGSSVAGTTGSGAGLDVSVRVDGTDYWEVGSSDYGLTPAPGDASDVGASLSSFANLVEGTLGQRDGAVAMLGMASPTGYLDLTLPSVSGATETGTSTVDGVPVSEYDVTVDPAQLASSAGTTPDEAMTIGAAVGVLDGQGYTGTTVQVGIDASGFIRQAVSTTKFGDGGTVVLAATFSDFGCAGTVLMPGQPGASSPPAGCTSPDTGAAPTTSGGESGAAATTSTTTVPASSTTSTTATTTTSSTTSSTTTTTIAGNS